MSTGGTAVPHHRVVSRRRGLVRATAMRMLYTLTWPEFFTMALMMLVGAAVAALIGVDETVGVVVALIGTRLLFALAKAWEETQPTEGP